MNSPPDAGQVIQTLVVANGTLLAGVFNATSAGDSTSAAFDSQTDSTYVVNQVPETVSIVDDRTSTVSRTLRVGGLPYDATYVNATGDVYVTGFSFFGGTGSIQVIDGANGSLTGSIPIATNWSAFGAAYVPSNGDLYVAERGPRGADLTIVSVPSDAVVGNISSVDGDYGTLAFDSANGDLYALEPDLGQVAVISPATNAVVQNISYPCGSDFPAYGSITYDPLNQNLYVVTYDMNWVSVISNDTVSRTVSLGTGPEIFSSYMDPIAVDLTDGYLYITNPDLGSVIAFDPATDQVVGGVPTGTWPVAAVYDSFQRDVNIVNSDSNNLSVWDPTRGLVVANVSLGATAVWGTVNPSDGNLYLLEDAPQQLVDMNASTAAVVRSAVLSESPQLIAYDGPSRGLYVVEENQSTSAGEVLAYDANSLTVRSSTRIGTGPQAIAVNSSSGDVYVTNFFSDNVSVLSGATNTTVASIAFPPVFGSNPVGIAYDPLNSRLYADAYTNQNEMYVIDGTTNSIVENATLSFAPDPGWIDAAPSTGDLYVTSVSSVEILNPTNLSEVGTVSTGADSFPYGLAYDPLNSYLYIASPFADTVTVVNTSTMAVVATLHTGIWPLDVVFDPVTSDLYVLNAGSGTISIISTSSRTPPTYSVRFTEEGLPAGTPWGLNLANGQSYRSDGTSLSFSEPNGTYPFNVEAVPGHYPSIVGSRITVFGQSVDGELSFGNLTPALGVLFQLYVERPDLQVEYPDANAGNLTSLEGLVAYAAEVVSGQILDRAYDQLAAPSYGYYFVLMGVYDSRSDLQAAFPNAFSNTTEYGNLLWWAGQVVTGNFADASNSTLGPWGYAYDLFALYESRADLQAAFPSAPFNLTEASLLVNWAGGVVTGSFVDTNNATLQPYGYWYALMYLYNGRSDLQAAYPNAWVNLTNYTLLVNWAGGVVTHGFTDSNNATVEPFGYYYDLMMVYDGRSDLQAAYPNAFTNSTSYATLLAWAKDVVEKVFADTAYTNLEYYATYYEEYG